MIDELMRKSYVSIFPRWPSCRLWSLAFFMSFSLTSLTSLSVCSRLIHFQPSCYQFKIKVVTFKTKSFQSLESCVNLIANLVPMMNWSLNANLKQHMEIKSSTTQSSSHVLEFPPCKSFDIQSDDNQMLTKDERKS